MKHKNYKSEKEGNVNDQKSNICYEIKKLTQIKKFKKSMVTKSQEENEGNRRLAQQGFTMATSEFGGGEDLST